VGTKTILPFSPKAGSWSRWLLSNSEDFQVPEPVTPTSDKEAYNKQLETTRQAALSRDSYWVSVINFWGGTPGTETPSGIWLNQLQTEEEKTSNEADFSRVQSVLAQSLADSFMETWKVKYTYWTQRPDMADSTIITAMPNPPFPAYVSGHSTISRTAASILGSFYPQKADLFFKNAELARDSRLYAGIHLPQDNEQGFKLGEKIGSKILEKIGKSSVTVGATSSSSSQVSKESNKTYLNNSMIQDPDYGNTTKVNGYLIKVKNTSSPDVKSILIASGEDPKNMQLAPGWSSELISTSPFWAPGACASAPHITLSDRYIVTDYGSFKPQQPWVKEIPSGEQVKHQLILFDTVKKQFSVLEEWSGKGKSLEGLKWINSSSFGYLMYPDGENETTFTKLEADEAGVSASKGLYKIGKTPNGTKMKYKKINLDDFSFTESLLSVPTLTESQKYSKFVVDETEKLTVPTTGKKVFEDYNR
jgi:hypothetical protein